MIWWPFRFRSPPPARGLPTTSPSPNAHCTSANLCKYAHGCEAASLPSVRFSWFAPHAMALRKEWEGLRLPKWRDLLSSPGPLA